MSLLDDVRLYVFREAAETGAVPQRAQIAAALSVPEAAVQEPSGSWRRPES